MTPEERNAIIDALAEHGVTPENALLDDARNRVWRRYQKAHDSAVERGHAGLAERIKGIAEQEATAFARRRGQRASGRQEPYTPADYMRLADAPQQFDPFSGPPGAGAPNVLRQPGEGRLPAGMEPRALGRMGAQTVGMVGGAAAGAPMGPPGMIAGGALGSVGARQAYDATLDWALGTDERPPVLSAETAMDAGIGAMGPAAGPVGQGLAAGARAVGRAAEPVARVAARNPLMAGGTVAGGTMLATQGETQQPLPDPTASDRNALKALLEQQATLQTQVEAARQTREANRPKGRAPTPQRDPNYTASDNEYQRLNNQMEALTGEVNALRQRTSPEYRAKVEQEAYEEQQRREKEQRNLPFQDRHPALANALPFISGGTALILSGLARGRNIGVYNREVKDIAGRWQQAIDDAGVASTPEARQQAMMTAQGLQQRAEALLAQGPRHSYEYGPAIAVGEMGQLAPSVIDYAASSPGSSLREHVMESINLRNWPEIGGRILQGAAWGYGGAKVGQGAGNLLRPHASMPNLGPQTEALRVPIGPRGPSGPTPLAPAEPAGPALPPPQPTGSLPSPGPAPQGPSPSPASPSLPPPAPPASSGVQWSTPQPNVTFGPAPYRTGPYRFDQPAQRQAPPERQTSTAPAPLPEFPSTSYRRRNIGPIEGRHWVRPGAQPRSGEIETWVSPRGNRAIERVDPDQNRWRIPRGMPGAGQFADPPKPDYRRISEAEPNYLADMVG